ncbi:MAG: VOC family protein [Sneathiella sp.]|nr:VOC family protein [Sneathiella sp.]
MPHNIVGLDHTLIGVGDLEKARDTYHKLGFTTTPRGSHIGWGTANYCIMFENDYIELLGIVDPTKESNGLDKQLDDRGEGMLGFALSTDNPEKTHASLTEAGLKPSQLLDLSRKLELPEGDVIPEFKLIRIPAEGLSKNSLFLCHHKTPELIRRPEWEQHANGASYIHSIVILMSDPKALVDYYKRLCGSLNVTVTDATVSIRVGRLHVIFVGESDMDLLFPGLFIPDDLPEFPHILSMTIGVENVEKTQKYLEGASIQLQKISTGSLRIQPKDACGVLMEFIQG